MTDAIGIGYFQFDNLVRNRIPFCLFLVGVSLESVYKGQELEHVLRYGIACDLGYSLESAVASPQLKMYRSIDPVLVLCSDGIASKEIADALGTRGFTNCYYLEGGLRQLLDSSRESKSF